MEGPPAGDQPGDDVGKLLARIEALEQAGTCCRLGITPSEALLAKLQITGKWTEQIKDRR